MLKIYIRLIIFLLFLNHNLVLAQVGINTMSPQGVFHIDARGDTRGMENGEDDIIVTHDGNVGIGTLNPDKMLTVRGDISVGEYKTSVTEKKWGPELHFLGKSLNSDYMYLYRYNKTETEGSLCVNIGDQADMWPHPETAPDYFVVGVTSKDTGAFRELFWVRSNGSVGMGRSLSLTRTSQQNESSLEVHGTIRVKGNVKVRQKPNLRMARNVVTDINELKEYVEINKHLPNIPSEEIMQREGVDLAKLHIEMQQIMRQLSVYTKDQYNAILRADSLLDTQSKKIEMLKNSLSY